LLVKRYFNAVKASRDDFFSLVTAAVSEKRPSPVRKFTSFEEALLSADCPGRATIPGNDVKMPFLESKAKALQEGGRDDGTLLVLVGMYSASLVNLRAMPTCRFATGLFKTRHTVLNKHIACPSVSLNEDVK